RRLRVSRTAEKNYGALQFPLVLLKFFGIGDGNSDEFSFERPLRAGRPTRGSKCKFVRRRRSYLSPCACSLPAAPTAGDLPGLLVYVRKTESLELLCRPFIGLL